MNEARLFERYARAELTDAEKRRLTRLLEEEEDASRRFAEFMEFRSLLAQLALERARVTSRGAPRNGA